MLAADARLWGILAYAAVVLGCVVRLGRFADNPTLWLDEAFLAINLMEKSFSDILGPLAFQQSAPPGFLLVEKAAESFIGDSELSLRLFSIVASLASMVLFAYIARRLLAAPAAVLAIVLFATGEPLLERAAELKPYSIDVAVATLIIALTLWVLAAPNGTAFARTGILCGVGLVVLWFSFPALFTLAGAVAAIGIHALEIGSRRLVVGAVVLAGTTVGMFAAVYAVASTTVRTATTVLFGDGGSSIGIGRVEIVQRSWSILDNPGGFTNGTAALAALLACFGVIAVARGRSFDRLALLTLPALLAVAAHLLDRYPLGGRYSLFLVPSLLVLVARGAQAITGWSRRPLLVGAGVAVFLVSSPLAIAGYHMFQPPAREDLRPVLRYLIREWRDGDSLYVFTDSQYALRYYATCEDCTPSGKDFPWPTRLGPLSPEDPEAPVLESVPPALIIGSKDSLIHPHADLDRLPRKGRLWLLFSHVGTLARFDAESALVTELEDSELPAAHDGLSHEVVRARGARLYLFNR